MATTDLISPVIFYQAYLLFLDQLPIDTGNMRYNAATLLRADKYVEFEIDRAEADYFDDVYEYYKYVLGDDFMERGVQVVYNFLVRTLQKGNKGLNDEIYIEAKRRVLSLSQSNERREVSNILYGTGKYGGFTKKQMNRSGTTLYEGLI